jgi:hypothetical protein
MGAALRQPWDVLRAREQRRYRVPVRYPYPVVVRLTGAEREYIYEEARAAGLSVSRYVARTLTEGRHPPTIKDREELLRLRYLLEKAGVNLNQIARQLNAWGRGGKLPPPSLSEVKGAAEAVRQLSREALRKMT